MLCLFRKARKADATALWEKREGLSLGRAASASFREAGPWFSLRLLGKRATTQGKREGRELFGTAALGERTALWAKREATGARSDVGNGYEGRPGHGISPPTLGNPWRSVWHTNRHARRLVAALAPAYVPRRPTDTALYGLVREHLESFLTYARDNYERGLPRYVGDELRAFLTCGVFSLGFLRARCDGCGFDLLVAFTCKSRTVCPSCAGRRMSNTGASIVDRVLPEVPVRQYVLSLPFELRKLAAFNAEVLTALGRIFVESLFGRYRAWSKRSGLERAQCGAINFVQRFGSSLNLNVHFRRRRA